MTRGRCRIEYANGPSLLKRSAAVDYNTTLQRLPLTRLLAATAGAERRMGIIGFAGEIFFEDKVVAHFKDGRIVKGHTRDFSPERDSFTLQPYSGDVGPVAVFLDELKAVFHVKTFDGNSGHPRSQDIVGSIDEPRFSRVMDEGRRVALQFVDGEKLWGFAEECGTEARGFFFFPTDPSDNNMRIYVVKSSLKEMVYLDN